MDGNIPREADHQATLASASVGILFKNLPGEQSFFDLRKRKLIAASLDLGVLTVHIPTGADSDLD
jgi:hypothetical protein